MLAFILLSSCIVCFFAYRFYGKFLTDRCKLDDEQTTPAFEKEDGVDYSPTRASVLFGHHFSSIAGAGPIVGPILAAMYFGWGPTWVWILVGAILVGGVHDFGSTLMSVRNGGRSIADTMRGLVGEGAGKLFMIFVVLALVYVIIVFLDLTANTFAKQPAVATASGWFIAVAVIFGFLMFRGRVSGPFFAIMSLALLSAIYMIVTDLQFLTNGSNGITPPNALEVFGVVIDPYDYASYWVVYAALVGLTILCKLLTQSKFGLVVQALKNDPERVRFLGYSVALYETVIYAISAFVAAVAGCCYVILTQYCSNAQFDVVFSISIVIWAAIGGRGSLLWQ